MATKKSLYRKAIEYIEVVPADELPENAELPNSRINSLALADLKKVKAELRASVNNGYGSDPTPELRGFDPGIVVAEGDSWFDYLPGIDLLDWLTGDWGWDIRRFAHAGDDLKTMVHGVDPGSNTPIIDTVLKKVKQYQPRVLLFSGGGNDVAGDDLDAYLEPVDSGLDPLNVEFAKVQMNRFAGYYADLIEMVAEQCNQTRIFVHGYGYMPVDGRGVRLFPAGWDFVGPWLKPSLVRHGVTERAEQDAIVAELLDMFNDMLAGVAAANPEKFTYIDLRGMISMDDWANELHLKNDAYRRCAALIHREIGETLGV